MNIEKETFDKLVEMGWTPPEKPEKYKLSEYGFRILQDGYCKNKSNVCTDWGVTRATKKSAKLAFERSWSTMKLSALAAELGGEKEFVKGMPNWYIYAKEDKYKVGCRILSFDPEKVYMTVGCAEEIRRMLNEGEFEL